MTVAIRELDSLLARELGRVVLGAEAPARAFCSHAPVPCP